MALAAALSRALPASPHASADCSTRKTGRTLAKNACPSWEITQRVSRATSSNTSEAEAVPSRPEREEKHGQRTTLHIGRGPRTA